MDFLPNFSDTDKQVFGSIFGAIIGALAGAFGVYKVGEYARQKQIELDEIKYSRQKLKANYASVSEAENIVHNLLILCLKNMGHTRDISQGIIKGNNAVFTMNLPSPYIIPSRISADILNVDLVVQWNALETEAALHSNNISEFNSYYTFLRNNIHTAQLNKEDLSGPTVYSNNQTIKKGAEQQLKSLEYFKQRCLRVLALIELYAEQQRNIDYTQIGLTEVKQYTTELIGYSCPNKLLKKKIGVLNKKYVESKAFGYDIVI